MPSSALLTQRALRLTSAWPHTIGLAAHGPWPSDQTISSVGNRTLAAPRPNLLARVRKRIGLSGGRHPVTWDVTPSRGARGGARSEMA